MIRIGIGIAVVVAIGFAVLGYGHRKYREGYATARNEIARTLQDDAAKKERAAIDAENSVSPTPESPDALAALCTADPDCRDKETKR